MGDTVTLRDLVINKHSKPRQSFKVTSLEVLDWGTSERYLRIKADLEGIRLFQIGAPLVLVLPMVDTVGTDLENLRIGDTLLAGFEVVNPKS